MSGHNIGLQNLRIETFNPKLLLFSVIDELQPLLHRQDLSINCIAEGAGDEILTDPYVFRQIISDLFSSLIECAQHSVIEVLLESEFHAPNTLVLMIEDGKLIISEEIQSALFLSTHPEPNLARAKYLVEILDGNIHVESEQNEGTAFIVTIPIKQLAKLDCAYIH